MEELVDATEGGMPDNLTIELGKLTYQKTESKIMNPKLKNSRQRRHFRTECINQPYLKCLSISITKASSNWSKRMPTQGTSFNRENYLNANYYQQALEHFTQAMKMNNSLFSQFEETKHYHSHILALLGRCYLESGNIDDGLELLNKTIKINKTLVGEEHVSNIQLYTLIAQAYEKKKEYDKSLEYLNMVQK